MKQSQVLNMIIAIISFFAFSCLFVLSSASAGVLYGISNNGSGTSVFGTINTSTGVLTSINSALTGDALFASMYDPATNLYYAVLEEDTGSTIDQRFMVINASDGSLITDVKDPQRLRSIELVSVPLPSTGWLFTAGMLSLVRVIKRKKVVLGSTNC